MIKFQVHTVVNFNGSLNFAERLTVEDEIKAKIKTDIKMKILETIQEYYKDGKVQGFDVQVFQ